MDTVLTKDARGFVDEVVDSLRHDERVKRDMPKIQAFLTKVTSQTKKEKIAKVESSVAITTKEKEDIENMLRGLLGREIMVDCVVKPDILGGLRIQVGDWVLDTSLSGQLSQLAAQLIQS